MSRGLQIIYDDEPQSRNPKRAWLPLAAGTFIIAMLVLGSFESPIPTPTELTTPPPLAIATMPDLNGSSYIAAGNRLSGAGLDRSLLSGARWVANPDVAPGTVAVQSPPPGTAVFHEEEIEVVMSSGGPTISWDQLPTAMQTLIKDISVPTDEPVLVLETVAGPVYKTDQVLFGDCRAVDLTRDTFYDQTYSETCPPAPITTIGGWLGDGAMYAVGGLPDQDYLDVASAVSLGPDQPLGRQLWSSSPIRRAPNVEVDGRAVIVTGGRYRFVLTIPADAKLTPNEVARLITPVDIRGDLVVTLAPPLTFYDKPGLAGNRTSGGQAARRHRQVPGEPFTARPTLDIVSRPGDIKVTVAEQYSEQVSVLAVPSTTWSTGSTGRWQFAYPAGWFELRDGEKDRGTGFVVSTSDQAAPVEMCGQYPVGALKVLGAGDASVSVTPSLDPDALEWPSYFIARDLDPPNRRSDCLAGIAATVYLDTRRVNGQSFNIVVAFDDEASDQTRGQAIAILASFEPAPSYARRAADL